jgi:tetratricopeptide (TPR) repeat protein
MKKFGKKSDRPDRKEPESPATPDTESSFYVQPDREAPLNEYSSHRGPQAHRSSRHTTARRRENNVRATDWQLARLTLKIIMVPVLLGVGYFGLKMAVNHFSKPHEETLAQWDDDLQLMDMGAAAGKVAADFGDKASMETFLEQLKQVQDFLESAAVLKQGGMNDEAVDRLEQALDIAPASFAVKKNLLELYMQQGRYEDVVPLSGRMLAQDASSQEAKSALLTALYETGRTEASVVLAERMLAQDPGDIHVMEVAAYSYAAQGRADEALQMYKQILEREPTHLLALEGAGTLHEWRKEWAKALPYDMELVRLDPQAKRYRVLAVNYAQQDQAGKTAIFLGQAFSLYGVETVAPWLNDPGFDPVREAVDFRSLADQIVGAKARQQIEQIRRREVQEASGILSGEIDLPSQRQLDILKPSSR